MKLLFDFFPLILMFAAYKMFDIYVATAVAIAATLIQVSYLKLRGKKVEPMMWIGLGVIVVMGGATIFFKNEMFVKWKPTIIFSAMAVAIGISQFGFKKNPIAVIFNNQITAPDALWRKLAAAWIVFLLALAAINLYFAYYQSTDAWFAMKTFGDMGLFLTFILAQMFWLYPYMPKDEEPVAPAPKVEAKES
jgi:intracellular septation protein